jgi:curli biogenesis system outer membrane secretion channel CsgG
MKDAVIGVVGFQGATPELREMLEGSLALKLGSSGFKVAERQRLKEVLQEAQFQNLGLTESTKAAELGRLVNAEYLLFGQLTTAGTMTSLALRLVGVSDGSLKNGIELECRDCKPDDYLEGLTHLIGDWTR